MKILFYMLREQKDDSDRQQQMDITEHPRVWANYNSTSLPMKNV